MLDRLYGGGGSTDKVYDDLIIEAWLLEQADQHELAESLRDAARRLRA